MRAIIINTLKLDGHYYIYTKNKYYLNNMMMYKQRIMSFLKCCLAIIF